MTAHLPPVPPAARSNKGTGESAKAENTAAETGPADLNTAEQGRQGNAHQNTTNKGYQQDR